MMKHRLQRSRVSEVVDSNGSFVNRAASGLRVGRAKSGVMRSRDEV